MGCGIWWFRARVGMNNIGVPRGKHVWVAPFRTRVDSEVFWTGGRAVACKITGKPRPRCVPAMFCERVVVVPPMLEAPGGSVSFEVDVDIRRAVKLQDGKFRVEDVFNGSNPVVHTVARRGAVCSAVVDLELGPW